MMKSIPSGAERSISEVIASPEASRRGDGHANAFKDALAQSAARSRACNEPMSVARAFDASDEFPPVRLRSRVLNATAEGRNDDGASEMTRQSPLVMSAMSQDCSASTDCPPQSPTRFVSTEMPSATIAHADAVRIRPAIPSEHGHAAEALPRQEQPESVSRAPGLPLKVLQQETHFGPIASPGLSPTARDSLLPDKPAKAVDEPYARLPPAPAVEEVDATLEPSGVKEEIPPDFTSDISMQVFEATRKHVARDQIAISERAASSIDNPHHNYGSGYLRFLKVQLAPEALGSITIAIASENGTLSLNMEAERQDVASRLEIDRIALVRRIAACGYELAELTVSTASTGSDTAVQVQRDPSFREQQDNHHLSNGGSMHNGSMNSRSDRENARPSGSQSDQASMQSTSPPMSQPDRPRIVEGPQLSRRFRSV